MCSKAIRVGEKVVSKFRRAGTVEIDDRKRGNFEVEFYGKSVRGEQLVMKTH